MDFSPEQQEVFLKKWFRAICCEELPPVSNKMTEQEWKERQKKRADQQSKTIIEFLKEEKNKAVQELAAVPMLLQIMAIIWKGHKHLPNSRSALYDVALNYLLAYRDKEKDIEPLLPVEQSRRVLAPIALWIQEDLEQEEAHKEQIHKTMQPILNTMNNQPNAVVFCEHLRDRAGLIDELKNHYIFRHKSFREFLAGIQLKEDAHEEKRIETLVEHFKDDWWEETLRFFMSKSDDNIFDRFMRAFFKSTVSQELNAHQQNLLQSLVREAPQKKIDALKNALNRDDLNDNQRRYILECLKTIGTPEAVKILNEYIVTSINKANISNSKKIIVDFARDFATELTRGTYSE